MSQFFCCSHLLLSTLDTLQNFRFWFPALSEIWQTSNFVNSIEMVQSIETWQCRWYHKFSYLQRPKGKNFFYSWKNRTALVHVHENAKFQIGLKIKIWNFGVLLKLTRAMGLIILYRVNHGSANTTAMLFYNSIDKTVCLTRLMFVFWWLCLYINLQSNSKNA